MGPNKSVLAISFRQNFKKLANTSNTITESVLGREKNLGTDFYRVK